MGKLFLIIALTGIILISIIGYGLSNSGEDNNNNSGKISEGLSELKLDVAIPCPGHAFLITNALEELEGVELVEYSVTGGFVVYYDSNKISVEDILSIKLFKSYPATIK